MTIKDRVEIAAGLKAGWTPARIAADLGRNRSVVTREIARNSTVTRGYRVVTADVSAQRRRARPQARRVGADPVLCQRVLADLKQSRTPRQIAGRLKLEAADPTVGAMRGSRPAGGLTASHEAIYQFIYAMPRGELARHGIFLQSKQTRRKPRSSTRRGAPIVGMRPISDRATAYPGAAERRVPGHWEGDVVIGKNGATCAATLVERLSRYVVILALPDGTSGKSSDALADVLIETVDALLAMMRASLTWDQGSEMARHAALTLATDLPVFFADPHSPWQREHQRPDPRVPPQGRTDPDPPALPDLDRRRTQRTPLSRPGLPHPTRVLRTPTTRPTPRCFHALTPPPRDRLTLPSYISTATKHGVDILTALRDALTGKPWIPAHATV